MANKHAYEIFAITRCNLLVYRLAEKMRIGVQPEMLVPFGDEEVLVTIGFRDGIKSLFVVQDIAGELL
jgi:hypothetical protein